MLLGAMKEASFVLKMKVECVTKMKVKLDVKLEAILGAIIGSK